MPQGGAAEGEYFCTSGYFCSSRWTGITHSYVLGLLGAALGTRHCVWLGCESRNLGSKASTHALQPAACSRGSRLRRSPGMDASPPAAQASALPFPHPSCPSVPWLLSPRCTPRHLQRDTAGCTQGSRWPSPGNSLPSTWSFLLPQPATWTPGTGKSGPAAAQHAGV